MGVETRRTYVCDGCGRRSDKSDFKDQFASGSATLFMSWHSGPGFSGDVKPTHGEDEFLLCHECFPKVRAFIGSRKK